MLHDQFTKVQPHGPHLGGDNEDTLKSVVLNMHVLRRALGLYYYRSCAMAMAGKTVP
jgi:hypothetical protein